MFVYRVTGGVLATNCYLVAGDEAPEAMVIDPGLADAACDRLLHLLATRGLTLRYVVNTHGHPDHTRGNAPLRRTTGAALLAHRADFPFLREPWAFLTAITARHAVPCPRCGTPLTPASTDWWSRLTAAARRCAASRARSRSTASRRPPTDSSRTATACRLVT
jgi:glyoxylase-like metal-dependent hydrolase (beta-lactamase superfamily II)